MKKTLSTLLILTVSLFAEINGYQNYRNLYNDMSDGKLTKPVLLMVGSTTCKFCKKELSKMNSDKTFSDFINNNMEFIYVNQDKDFLPIDYYAEMTPAFFILSPRTLKPINSKPAYGAIDIYSLQDWLYKIVLKYRAYKEGY